MNLDAQRSTSKLVLAHRQEHTITLLECRKDFYGVVGIRLGVLRLAEDKDGEIVSSLDSLELTGIQHSDTILRNYHAE